jgi:[acyl-carrier-protein] S-malonyltransferase
MSKIAVIFPGQGSQFLKMGKDLWETYPLGREIIKKVEKHLNFDLTDLIVNGPIEKLTLTSNAQPCILTVSMMTWYVLENYIQRPLIEIVDYFAGHSLGEYTALCASGSYTIEQATSLVQLRGKAMENALNPSEPGTMAAILGLERCIVDEICIGINNPNYTCVVANDNAPGQIVVSGHRHAVEECVQKTKEKGSKHAVILPVSGPFHSPLMKKASQAMEDALKNTPPLQNQKPVISNVEALPFSTTSHIIELLTRQVVEPVQWTKTIQYLNDKGCSIFIEVGPGKVLSNLIKRIIPCALTYNVQNPQDIEEVGKMLANHF